VTYISSAIGVPGAPGCDPAQIRWNPDTAYLARRLAALNRGGDSSRGPMAERG